MTTDLIWPTLMALGLMLGACSMLALTDPLLDWARGENND